MFRPQSISAPTAATTPKLDLVQKLAIDEVFVNAFVSEAVCTPSEALNAIQLAALYNLGNFVDAEKITVVLQDCSKADVVNFVASFLTATAYQLMVNGDDPTDAFRAVARSVVPIDVPFNSTTSIDVVTCATRFSNGNNVVGLLLTNPIALGIVILRLNLTKIMPLLHTLGEYSASVNAKED